MQELLKRGIIPVATVCGVSEFGCPRVFAVEGVVDARYGVIGQSILLLRNTWPKVLQVLRIFKEQGLVLAVLLGLSAFFFMAETSITILWAWEGIAFKLAKKKKGMMIGFVSFEDEELKSSSKNFEGKTISDKTVKVVDVIPRSFQKKTNSSVASHQDWMKGMILRVEL